MISSLLPPLLFAVHPLVTEAVCEPTFREDLLVAFFTLAGLLLTMGHSPQAARDPWRALGCLACCLLAIASKESGIAAPVALVVVPLLPVSNLVPIYRAAADRYLYLPLAGVALAVGFGIDGPWLATRPWLRERLLMAGLAAAVLLGLATTERQRVWASSLALWDDTFRKNPVAYTAASGLGEALREAGRLPEAERVIREAIRLSDGKRGDAWAALALILDGQGRTADADAALDRAIEAEPKLADPEARVAALAMERSFADDLLKLQQLRAARR